MTDVSTGASSSGSGQVARPDLGDQPADSRGDLAVTSRLLASHAAPYIGAHGLCEVPVCADLVRLVAGALRRLGRPSTLGAICDAALPAGGLDRLHCELLSAVYSRYTFQMNVLTADFERWRSKIESVTVRPADVTESRSLPEFERMSPFTFTHEEVELNGSKCFNYPWQPNHGAMSVMVGDVHAAVLRWRLTRPDLRVNYDQQTREEPEPADEELADAFEAWCHDSWHVRDDFERRSIVDGLRALAAVSALAALFDGDSAPAVPA